MVLLNGPSLKYVGKKGWKWGGQDCFYCISFMEEVRIGPSLVSCHDSFDWPSGCFRFGHGVSFFLVVQHGKSLRSGQWIAINYCFLFVYLSSTGKKPPAYICIPWCVLIWYFVLKICAASCYKCETLFVAQVRRLHASAHSQSEGRQQSRIRVRWSKWKSCFFFLFYLLCGSICTKTVWYLLLPLVFSKFMHCHWNRSIWNWSWDFGSTLVHHV